MKFDNLYNELAENKANHIEGYFNCIPFVGMERLERYVPGIEHATYYLLTASSGIGKSKLLRYLFIHIPYEFVKNNPDSGIKLSVIYFSLEESKKKVVYSEMCKYLYVKHNIIVSTKELQSIGRFNTISEDVLEKVKESREYINKFMETVDIVDNIRNPTGMYKYVRDYALTVGTYYDKNDIPLTKEEVEQVRTGKGDAYMKVSYYKKHNPKHYIIVATDHLGLVESEDGLTQHQTMSRYSTKYCMTMRDKFGLIPVNVQQQTSDKEAVEYNFKGRSIEEKLEPSLDALGENKTIQRDANIVLGLFAPDRYKIATHSGYDITRLRDMYRSMSILKDRDGISNKKLPLFFNGAIDFFKELPSLEDKETLERAYNKITSLIK